MFLRDAGRTKSYFTWSAAAPPPKVRAVGITGSSGPPEANRVTVAVPVAVQPEVLPEAEGLRMALISPLPAVAALATVKTVGVKAEDVDI
jgi:hypothetical protein